jgi:hypothetical protein
MRRFIMLLGCAVVLMALAPTGAGGATKLTCAGTVVVVPNAATILVKSAGTQQFVEFDFTGTHPLCLRDGTQVTATIAGHFVQRTSPDGDLTIRFEETMSYGAGSLDFRGEASLSGSNWQSHVQSVGQGTGPMSGLSAQGSFFPTANPSVLTDVLVYIYH